MMDKEMLSPGARLIIQRAFRLAWELGREYVDSAHILWGLSQSDGTAGEVLRRAGFDADMIRDILNREKRSGAPGHPQYMYISPDAARIWELAEAQARRLHHSLLEPEHLLLAILQESECVALRILVSTGVETEQLAARLLEQQGQGWPADPEGEKAEKSVGTPTLDQYTRDLTLAARNGALDPVIGRDTEVQRVVQILSRRTKNNPVLTGEPGVGKTAIAEGLAQRIVQCDIPQELADKRILTLDLPQMLAGTKFRGDFEERIKSAIEEASRNRDIILFIDELHTLIGAGSSEGSMDAANILKPALSRGEIQVIGATTLGEYRRHIEKDPALERRFQPVHVDEPTAEDAIAILTGLRERYEQHHGLTIADEAVQAAVHLSARYIQDRFLPDKAIDLMDEAASRVRTWRQVIPEEKRKLEERIAALEEEKQDAVRCQDYEQAALLRDRQNELRREAASLSAGRKVRVTGEDIAAVVSMWTGIPSSLLTEDESRRLLQLEEILHRRLVGQEEAVSAVARAVRRNRTGIRDPKRPAGTFLFLGPTGVGKTELCRALAEVLFQNESAMLRVDMSEYMEPHTVSRLIGSPPGYVGHDEGGQLTKLVRQKPYSVILFDEIEKAHRDVWNVLLQIMEDGHLTDAQGRRVDFKNSIIVMTSNAGAEGIQNRRKPLGFHTPAGAGDTTPPDEIRGKVMQELRTTFRPEFLNRIDDIIVFHQLEKEHIRSIARNMMTALQARLKDSGVLLRFDEETLELLAEKGFDPDYGARPLRRVIQSDIEDPIAELLLQPGAKDEHPVSVTVADGSFRIAPEQKVPSLPETVTV